MNGFAWPGRMVFGRGVWLVCHVPGGARAALGLGRRMAAIIAEKKAAGVGSGEPARRAAPVRGVGV